METWDSNTENFSFGYYEAVGEHQTNRDEHKDKEKDKE